MAAFTINNISILISSDENCGITDHWVILFGDIPTVIPSTSVVAPEASTIAPVISSAAPMVETTLVASPTGLCGLVPYTGSDSDSPDEMTSPEHISPLLAISPFICTDSSGGSRFFDGPPHEDTLCTTIAPVGEAGYTGQSSSFEFPIAPVTAPHPRGFVFDVSSTLIPTDPCRPYVLMVTLTGKAL
ncbi:hypothetical protein Tco_1578499 [Tanacetum coccineum]